MMREQFINFLEATVVFLLLTNALGVFAAAYAISLAHDLVRPDPGGACGSARRPERTGAGHEGDLALAQTDRRVARSIPSRAALHARAGTEMAGEACA